MAALGATAMCFSASAMGDTLRGLCFTVVELRGTIERGAQRDRWASACHLGDFTG